MASIRTDYADFHDAALRDASRWIFLNTGKQVRKKDQIASFFFLLSVSLFHDYVYICMKAISVITSDSIINADVRRLGSVGGTSSFLSQSAPPMRCHLLRNSARTCVTERRVAEERRGKVGKRTISDGRLPSGIFPSAEKRISGESELVI